MVGVSTASSRRAVRPTELLDERAESCELMQEATALRIVSVVVAAKAVLIGVVYWRRAEILGRPVHIGAGSWACLIAVVTIGVAIALTVCVAARHQNGDRTR
ncbi:MAG: hypothetical protein QOE94_1345 [Mycobacterium sp.]|nr:hypothetical protein [Mycobacterium sp.]